MDQNMPGTMAGCNLTSTGEQSQQQPAGAAYPNPFANEINFSVYLAQPEDIVVTIVNSLGQQVMIPVVVNGNSGTNTVSIQMPADLPAGMYMMQISAGANTWTQTLVKAVQ
jgi:hypothetical protein